MRLTKLLLIIILISPLDRLSSAMLEDLTLNQKYSIEIFASDLDSPRQLAESSSGRIFVGSKRGGKIFAIRDTDGNGEADEQSLVAEGLTMATGVSFFNGDLFFSEINKIWKVEQIDQFLDQNLTTLPKKILVTDDLPSDEWHGWKWIMHDQDGDLYTNVGAPCNVCISEDKKHASILRLRDGSWDYVARGVRNSV